MRLLTILFISFWVAPLIASAQPAVEKNKGPQTYAVVVGIAGYLEKDIPQLRFANRDAEAFSGFLRSKAGGSVPEDNITLLVDSQATTSAVYDAIYQLSKTAGKGDLVYFYFSGHGDLENATMYKNGFLICYDSPPTNYVKLALSVDYLNDIANTLSAQTLANVVLITDACHSGKLAGSRNKGTFLVGDQLRRVRDKEIRITSCAENQLSNENEAWGGGRGVFSYYLINGLKGLADRQKDGIVTLDEIKHYLDSSLSKDPVLNRENLVQTPVLKGNGGFSLAKTDMAVARETEQEMRVSLSVMQASAPVTSTEELIPANGQQYFFSLLKKVSLESLTEGYGLDDVDTAQLSFTIIKSIADQTGSAAGQAKLKELETTLRSNAALLKKFSSKLAVAFDEKGQRVINQYLIGDEAELERRRYYNAENNGYDVYPKMFSVAMKLTSPDSYLRKILEMKMHYFKGVSIRLKIPTVKEPLPLVDQALEEQKKALALEENAAYIYNELGVLSAMKKDYPIAEKYYKKAGEIAPEWVVPWANLSGLYAVTRSFEKGMEATEKAKAISPGLLCIYVNSGFLQEKKGDLLRAEEDYRKSIYLNSRHYSPYERLGHVYLNTTQYALADSFLYEAEVRKKGFHFEPGEFDSDKQGLTPMIDDHLRFCKVDSNDVGKKDVLGLFSIGFLSCESYGPLNPDGVRFIERGNGSISPPDMERAERAFRKIISLDNTHPLAYHYLGKLLYWQNKWAEAEVMLKLALVYRPDSIAFIHYLDSLAKSLPKTASRDCIIQNAEAAYFNFTVMDDHYFLASLYEKWNHFDEAEKQYRRIISIAPNSIGGYFKLWNMLEALGRYRDAENLILSFMADNPDKQKEGKNELNAFYSRVLKVFPYDPDWNYRAGLFLYRLAAEKPSDYPYDRKTLTPDTHVEQFQGISDEHLNFYPLLPGPFRDLQLFQGASDIKYPLTDAIQYLVRADSLSNFPDADLAGINEKLGDIYTWQGLPGKAVSRYQRSLMMQPQNSGVRMKLIDANDVTFHFQDALAELDSLDKRREINYSKLLLKAKYQMQAGDFTEAGKLLKRAEKLDPIMDPVLIGLNGRLMMLSGKTAEAIPWYQKLLERDPGNSDLQYTMAKLYARMGKDADALKWLNYALNTGFRYSFVIAFDNDWDKFRNQQRWTALTRNLDMKQYPLNVKPFKSLFEGY